MEVQMKEDDSTIGREIGNVTGAVMVVCGGIQSALDLI